MGLDKPKENTTVPTDPKLQCSTCPLKTGSIPVLQQGLDMTAQRVCTFESNCREQRKECAPAINSKVGLKIFWPVVVILIGIASSVIAFTLASQSEYKHDHNELHKELNYEIKQVNRELGIKIHQISEDVVIIKTKIENGGGG